jgi:hypothetical protein
LAVAGKDRALPKANSSRSNPEDDVDFEKFIATHAAGGGGKMSRDCCFKCAPSTLKHMSALKDRP